MVVHAGEAPRTGAPRRLTLAALIALCCWEAIAGRPGLSLVLLVALLPASAGAERHGRSAHTRWAGCRACSPRVLGMVGLGGAFPRIAGQARSRLGAGPAGRPRLLVAHARRPAAGDPAVAAAPAGTPARASWEESVGQAASHVVAPALTLGVLLGALLWGAGAALVLPWIVRGREPLLDAIAAGLWALALVLVQPAARRGPRRGCPRAAPGRRPRGPPRRLRGARRTRACGVLRPDEYA